MRRFLQPLPNGRDTFLLSSLPSRLRLLRPPRFSFPSFPDADRDSKVSGEVGAAGQSSAALLPHLGLAWPGRGGVWEDKKKKMQAPSNYRDERRQKVQSRRVVAIASVQELIREGALSQICPPSCSNSRSQTGGEGACAGERPLVLAAAASARMSASASPPCLDSARRSCLFRTLLTEESARITAGLRT